MSRPGSFFVYGANAREQNGLLVTFCQRVIENFYCKTG